MKPRTPDSRDNVYMDQARAIARLSKDNHTQHGAVIVGPDKIVISQGYNGPPAAIDDEDIDWDRPHKYPYMMHAEQNAVLFGIAARGLHGLRGSTLYVTGPLCSKCALLVVWARLAEVKYGEVSAAMVDIPEWHTALEVFSKGGVQLSLVLTPTAS